jgi:glucuronokinase
MIIRAQAYPRAGLIGNPSDGYFGKTMAFTFSNFRAEVTLYETPELEILPSARDHSRFESLDRLSEDVRLFGYYGGIRLLKAAVKRFRDFCTDEGIELHKRNFTIRYDSNIPHLVGLAGSSAIITACMRALMAFYGVTLGKPRLANLILSVETDELRIAAGLQDRVAQVYQGLVYMDFDKDRMAQQGYGDYITLDTAALPSLYIAYRTDLSEISGVYHQTLRQRFENGDPAVLAAIANWKRITDEFRDSLLSGDSRKMAELIDANFDQRRAISHISEGNLRMVELARSVGASAKFTGSGGAIIGTFAGQSMLLQLRNALEPHGVRVIIPSYISSTEE